MMGTKGQFYINGKSIQEILDLHDIDYVVIQKQNQDLQKLEKALDKACVILNDFHKTQIKEKGFMYLDGRPQKQWWHCQEWKEYLLKESEKQ